MSANVSIIIPTFNRVALLPRALASVFNQSLPAREIIVVDDGSQDGTQGMVRTAFPNVRYLQQPNQGVSSARNLGIRLAKGAWLAFLDSDDEWLPNKLQCQMEALQAQSNFQICHSDELWIRNGQRVNPMKKHAKAGGHIFRRCLPLCVISPSTVLIHRQVFAKVGLFDEALPACEDYDLWLRISARYPVLLLEQALIIKHGGHTDQLSRRYQSMDRFRIRALEKVLGLPELSPENKQATRNMLLKKIAIYQKGAAKHGRHWESLRYKGKALRYRVVGSMGKF